MTGFIVAAPVVVPPGGGGGGGGGGTDSGGGSTGGGTGNFTANTRDPSALSITLIGGDGSSWDLTNGNVQLIPGVQAFASPTVTHWWQTSPAIDGSRWTGMRTAATEDILPIQVVANSWDEWRKIDSAFFRAIHPGAECTLVVTAPDGVSRSKRLRFVSDGAGAMDIDPFAAIYATYALEFTAANPFWAGDPVSLPFSAKTPVPFFPGPPFFINPAAANAAALVSNPGDEPVWPRYTVTGPVSSWSVGVGDALVSSDTAVADGDAITVDMGANLVVNAAGGNAYTSLKADSFAPIPAGAMVDLNLTVVGGGPKSQVLVEFTPLYRRAW